ncbi:hypothetical protein SAMN04490203_2398 [Pseudomonas taetrolens]|uniref:Uncharacterized protein n=1 Tax=Pseudomonas taetrolens TaxID=47884 RepID=A0A1H4SFI3_PSETA|nr:hypothetical protein [Pseudomonas taetrolens]SEC42946.1 hypothetical protein SAMN04490203_2398 [Pseudomonas taetrolens]SQF86550.1 Uncharacterised protein [Pseudomonas taetrolens]VEH49627.1 Uncharacterised protein [Pseudomonas taetrolens]
MSQDRRPGSWRDRQAAVTSTVRPNVDDVDLKAPFNDVGDIL